MLNTANDLMERGRIPDWLTRIGIRRLLAERLRTDNGHNPQVRDVELARLIPQPRDSAVAPRAATVNQHLPERRENLQLGQNLHREADRQ